jgi:hypothetical protein
VVSVERSRMSLSHLGESKRNSQRFHRTFI